MVRRPFMAPLSRQNGANPTRALICLLDNKPSSGNWAINVDAVIKPTPSTWVNCSKRFCKVLSLAINTFILSSMRLISLVPYRVLSKARINFSIERMDSGSWAASRCCFSIVLCLTNWSRRLISASNWLASVLRNAKGSGLAISPYCRIPTGHKSLGHRFCHFWHVDRWPWHSPWLAWHLCPWVLATLTVISCANRKCANGRS